MYRQKLDTCCVCGCSGVKESDGKTDRPWLTQGAPRSMCLQGIPREKAVGKEGDGTARCLSPTSAFQCQLSGGTEGQALEKAPHEGERLNFQTATWWSLSASSGFHCGSPCWPRTNGDLLFSVSRAPLPPCLVSSFVN